MEQGLFKLSKKKFIITGILIGIILVVATLYAISPRCGGCKSQPLITRIFSMIFSILYPFGYTFFSRLYDVIGESLWRQRTILGLILEAAYIYIISVIVEFIISLKKR